MAEYGAPLAQAIEVLRSELQKAMATGADDELRFDLGSVELELQIAVSRETGAEAGVKFWLISVGGKGSVASSETHTVRLSLVPVIPEAG